MDELGLQQVEIRLNGPVSRSLLTDINGFFEFRDLPAGTFSLEQIQPTTYDDGLKSLGLAGGTVTANGFSGIIVASETQATGYRFGELLRPKQAINSIGGIVYLDVNNNGQRDPVERVLPNVPIAITGAVSRQTFTDANGAYAFIDLPDGVYSVIQTHPSDFLDGKDTIGTPTLGTVGADRFDGVQLSNNISAINYNFGERGLLYPNKSHLLSTTPPPEQLILQLMRGAAALRALNVLPVTVGFNPHLPMDTSYDGIVSPIDVLVVINALRRQSQSEFGLSDVYTTIQNQYLDSNGDGVLSPFDVLVVINQLNRQPSIFLRVDGRGSD